MTSITFKGEAFASINKLCKEYGVKGRARTRVYDAVKGGGDISEAMEKKRRPGSEKADAIRKAAAESGINIHTLTSRVRVGMTLEEAISKRAAGPGGSVKVIINGVEYKSIASAARFGGINASTLKSRIDAGWNDKDLLKTGGIVSHHNLGPIKKGRYRGENDYNRVMDYIERFDDDDDDEEDDGVSW